MALRTVPAAGLLLAIATASVLGQYFGARLALPWLSASAASLLPIVSLAVATALLWHRWWLDPVDPAAEVRSARQYAQLIALNWGAGASAMLAVYLLSGLRWQHGWQYGSGMALIAVVGFAYANQIAQPGNRLAGRTSLDAVAALAAAQGLAATAGLVALVVTGKAWSTRGDWAANVIFIYGGIALALLSALAVAAHVRLRRR